LWISHDLSLVARLAGEIAVMDEGKIVETSPTREFFANPHTAAARHLLSALPGWKEQPS
jgi:ABC-type dipeptide/oligopeptide/nickel transport system ATPase component